MHARSSWLMVAAALWSSAAWGHGARPEEEARVLVDATPAARAFLDGDVALGTTPLEMKLARPGRHTFTFRRAGFGPRTITAEVPPGGITRVSAELALTVPASLATLGLSVFFGYGAAHVAAPGRAVGLGSARGDGMTVGLALQLLHFLEVQGDFGAWGFGDTSSGGAPAFGEGKATQLQPQAFAGSLGITTPFVPFVPPWPTRRGAGLFLAAAARIGRASGFVTRRLVECDECQDQRIELPFGPFHELSVTAALGRERWPDYGGVGVRVAYRRFTSRAAGFADVLMLAVEGRFAVSVVAPLPRPSRE